MLAALTDLMTVLSDCLDIVPILSDYYHDIQLRVQLDDAIYQQGSFETNPK
jgi:hypothetical protein